MAPYDDATLCGRKWRHGRPSLTSSSSQLALALVSVRPDFLLFPPLCDEVHVRLHRTIKEVKLGGHLSFDQWSYDRFFRQILRWVQNRAECWCYLKIIV